MGCGPHSVHHAQSLWKDKTLHNLLFSLFGGARKLMQGYMWFEKLRAMTCVVGTDIRQSTSCVLCTYICFYLHMSPPPLLR